MFGLAYGAIPEYRDRLASGGPLLDLGSGAGGALLSTLAMFPGLRAVGVEVVGAVAHELRARAADSGVADRVEIHAADASELTLESEFGACYWAQAFFAPHTRAGTLEAVRRALRPTAC